MYELGLLLSVFIYTVVLFYFIRSGVASVFHPVGYYLFFHGLVFVVRPVIQYVDELNFVYNLYRFYPSEDVKLWSLIVANVGFISFCAVALNLAHRPMSFHPAEERDPARHDRGGAQLILAFIICSPLIVLSVRNQLVTAAGAETLISMAFDRRSGISISTEGSVGYINDANQMLIPLTVLIAWVYRFRLLSLLPFAAFALFRIYLGGGRWAFVLSSMSLVLLYLYDQRQRWMRGGLIAALLVVMVVFHLVGENRDAFKNILLGIETKTTASVERQFFDAMDFANLEYLQYVIWVVPDLSGTYDYFLHNLQIFTEPIPRALWPEKPIGPPIRMFNYFDYGNPIGFTVSLPGQGWASLGIFGVVIWCGFGGLIWASFYNWFLRGPQGRFQIALFATLLPISVQWFRDGALMSLIKFPLFLVIPILIWALICRLWRPYAPLAEGPAGSRGKR